MTSIQLWAAVAGLAAASGLLLLLAGLPVMNRPKLGERVAPYVRSAAPDAAAPPHAAGSLRSAVQLFTPVVQAASDRLSSWGLTPSTETLATRLRHANLSITVTEYRLQQLGWASAAAATGLLITFAAAAAGRFSFPAAVLIIAAAAALGAAARDARLSARIRSRQARMLSEFPTIAELLALAVSAGETAPGAFLRISRSCRGELADELTELICRTQAGVPFGKALRQLSAEIEAPAVSRFFEGVIVAVERGTPLADVMRAQAADARELTKRELMETAGRKEVGMLAPVVFGILPLTILFAAFPGLSLLQISL
ncbi:type II secretion system F family protein [Nesterenkonia ebinurensis]|uniref:type II secretion system F family protein n=1 Tax=Nesterenkonia ebinurensis TaxID=2608252 RepID=UPI00123D69E7|nr:type II secretion system F family protein [Nesterenkonia ebinurensis]